MQVALTGRACTRTERSPLPCPACANHPLPCAQVAPNYPIVRNNLAVALTDLGTMLKVKGQLKAGADLGAGISCRSGSLQSASAALP